MLDRSLMMHSSATTNNNNFAALPGASFHGGGGSSSSFVVRPTTNFRGDSASAAGSHSPVPTANGTAPSVDAVAPGGTNNAQQLSVILTVRMLMQGKEVGSIIGKRGDYVRQIREQSGAKINISDGSCPERIVTISGPAGAINKAFTKVAHKFEEDMEAMHNSGPKPPITLRLLIAASQCGSLIGKGGAKIREIRDKTGASLQVASEMLSNSTEKPVTISGSSEALIGCMREVCQILLDAPAKGPTIQYKPAHQAYNPLAVVSSAAAIAALAHSNNQQKAQQAMPPGMASLPAAATGGFGQAFNALLPQAMAPPPMNPFLTLQEMALLQHHQQQQLTLNLNQHNLNMNPLNLLPSPFDPSSSIVPNRFLLQSNSAGGTGVPASSSAAFSLPPNVAAAGGGILANQLAANPHLSTIAPTSAVASQTHQQQTSLEQFYANNGAAGGLDPASLAAAVLAVQHQQGGGSGMDPMAQQQQQQQAQAVLQLQLQQQQQQQLHFQMFYQQQQLQQQAGPQEDGQSAGRMVGSNGQSVKEVGSGVKAQKQQRFTPY